MAEDNVKDRPAIPRINNVLIDGGDLDSFLQLQFSLTDNDFSRLRDKFPDYVNLIINAKDENGKTTKDKIIAKYDDEKIKLLADGTNNIEDFIEWGTSINIPTDITLFLGSKLMDNIEKIFPIKRLDAFFDDAIKAIIEDEGYKPAITQKEFSNFFINKKYFNDATVLLYSRALDQIINISPFYMSINTSVSDNGGNFNIMLPPITAECKLDNDEAILEAWDLIQTNMFEFFNGDGVNFAYKDFISSISEEIIGGGDFTFKFGNENTEVETRNNIIYKQFLFNVIIQPQDLIFIKFEKLQLEQSVRSISLLSADLKGNFFDMIGLVDLVGLSNKASQSDVVIQVQGRDLSKILLDDIVYFPPNISAYSGKNIEGKKNLAKS